MPQPVGRTKSASAMAAINAIQCPIQQYMPGAWPATQELGGTTGRGTNRR